LSKSSPSRTHVVSRLIRDSASIDRIGISLLISYFVDGKSFFLISFISCPYLYFFVTLVICSASLAIRPGNIALMLRTRTVVPSGRSIAVHRHPPWELKIQIKRLTTWNQSGLYSPPSNFLLLATHKRKPNDRVEDLPFTKRFSIMYIKSGVSATFCTIDACPT
jgi:hypothetical protein